MSTQHALQSETFVPADNSRSMADIYDFLSAHAASGRSPIEPRYFLAGSEPGDQVEIPSEVHAVLRQVINAMSQGLAVTVSPQSRTLTTQQAADLLGISRPTLVKLLDAGDIPFEKVSTHRRVLLRDVLAYREKRRAAQYEALEATSVAINSEDDMDQTLANLREARRVVAARRRAAKTV